jgi:hypothetical protein
VYKTGKRAVSAKEIFRILSRITKEKKRREKTKAANNVQLLVGSVDTRSGERTRGALNPCARKWSYFTIGFPKEI